MIPTLPAGACSGETELTAPEGEISVRGDAYKNAMSCRWLIKAPSDSVSVLLIFNGVLQKFEKVKNTHLCNCAWHGRFHLSSKRLQWRHSANETHVNANQWQL